MSAGQITRGGDLTEEDIALLAEDAFVTACWAMRNHLKRERWIGEIQEALRARLGRRRLVIADKT